MAHANDDKQSGDSSEAALDAKTCRECDVFGEDRCSIHAGQARESGFTKMTARYAGACRMCRTSFQKGATIFWSPDRRAICEPCGTGRDPVENRLTAEQRDRLRSLMETMQELETLDSAGRSIESQERFEITLAALYGEFRTLSRVRLYLERHMEALKSIPARQGMLHSRPLIARKADVCGICNRRTDSGELIWWSPDEPLMCFDCGRGKDPVELELHDEDRRKLAALLLRVEEYEHLKGSWNSEQKSEYDALLIQLYSKFRNVVRVKRLLLKHIGNLKEIASKKGPGDSRTVIAKQDDSCKRCSRTIDKGEVVWWSPNQQRLCFDCGQLDDCLDGPSPEERVAIDALLERLAALNEQIPENLPAAWAAKWADEREDVLIELYCQYRQFGEVRRVLYDYFAELCAIAGKATG